MRKYLDIPLTAFVAHHPECGDALAPGGAPARARGQRQARALHRLPAGSHGPLGLLPVFIGASAFGGAIELIQPSFNRSADMNDWVADTVGVAMGIGFGPALQAPAPPLTGALAFSLSVLR